MWAYLLPTGPGVPRPGMILESFRTIEAAGQAPRLLLADRADARSRAAGQGHVVLLGTRGADGWRFHGEARLGGPASRGVPPVAVAQLFGAESGPAWWRPISGVIAYDTPHDETAAGLAPGGLPRRGAARLYDVPDRPSQEVLASAPDAVDVCAAGLADEYARTSVSRVLFNPDLSRHFWESSPRRKPAEAGGTSLTAATKEDEKDPRRSYIIELNVRHIGGLSAAAHALEHLIAKVLGDWHERPKGSDPSKSPPVPDRIARSYYRCDFRIAEWRRLLAADEREAIARAHSGKANPGEYRCIYKLWPDFAINTLVDRSATTIKADAARRTFEASGQEIVWAVLDSGVQADHPHFGDDSDHVLRHKDVVDLHRSFIREVEVVDGVPFESTLKSPDDLPGMDPDERSALVDIHRRAALTDAAGHGTHVAGIIAGGPRDDARVRVYERQFKIDDDGMREAESYGIRSVEPGRLRGVAPRCKIVSLKVLDENGRGSVSSVIRALDYIRERLNDNPRMLRVHGVNLSVGYPFDARLFACGQSPICVEVNRLVQSGVVVVVAAGNSGFGALGAQSGAIREAGLSNSINDPGNAEAAITVGSTHRDSPYTYGVSFFSSKGPTGDGRLKPDLIAPGERITSCAVGKRLAAAVAGAGAGAAGPPTAAGQATYVDDSGTSMAAPHVSGAVAAFLSIRREFIGRPADVKRIFLESATPLGRERYFEGNGLLDLMRAIQSI